MLKYQVSINVVIRANDLLQLDDVRVLELHEKHDFAVGTLGVGGIVKCVEILLESLDFFVFIVDYLPDMTVGTTADFLDDFELAQDVRLQVLSHIFIT